MKSRKLATDRKIAIRLPGTVLKEVDKLAQSEDMGRDELILEAIKRFLKPHMESSKPVTKAISESTDKLKTGRYEP